MAKTFIDWSASVEGRRRNQRLMDELVEVTAAPGAHPALFNLLDCLTDWVQAYEASHAPIDNAHPAEVLKHLMDANGLRQLVFDATELANEDLKVEVLQPVERKSRTKLKTEAASQATSKPAVPRKRKQTT